MSRENNGSSSAFLQADWKGRAHSMWIRARTNAFAHKVAANQLGIIGGSVFVLQTLFVIVPIICVGLSLHCITTQNILSAKIGGMSVQNWVTILGVTAIISNGLAMLLNMLAARFQWSERQLIHKNLLAGYQLIAQKVRRLDDQSLKQEEGASLCRHLEEIFEIYKAMGVEPSDRAFCKANGFMAKLKAYPFGISSEEFA